MSPKLPLLATLACLTGSAFATQALNPEFQVTPHAGTNVHLVAYGDQRFTDPAEKDASHPAVRVALVRAIAAEAPDAVLITGDLPWHGGTAGDYATYLSETAPWRTAHIDTFPALGNHEFAGCAEADCLTHWWEANPRLQGLRWYAVAVGPLLRAFALDSQSPFDSASAQRQWLDAELAALPASVRYVVLYLHHPPVAAHEIDPLRHNVRSNEALLAEYLDERAKTLPARLVVVSGHIHNYEHREHGGVVYLVSGGGGAKPYLVSRDGDLYRERDEPNFHYLTLDADSARLHIEMHRLQDPEAAAPHLFEVRERFDVTALPARP